MAHHVVCLAKTKKTTGDEEDEGAIATLDGAIICENNNVLSLHGAGHAERFLSGRDA